ncbi:peptidase U32 family protein [Escherichia coli]
MVSSVAFLTASSITRAVKRENYSQRRAFAGSAIFQLLNQWTISTSTELLSPARDAAIAREAILHGAVYMGRPGFGARSNPHDRLKDIAELVPFAHRYGAKIFVTLNTILHDDELKTAPVAGSLLTSTRPVSMR